MHPLLQISMIDLNKLKEETGANIVVIADKDGKIIDSINTEYSKNLALMGQAAFSMCNNLLNDISSSSLDQLIARSADNYFIVNKIKSDNLVLIASDNLSRFGLVLKYMNSINNKY
ncbi:roadblock/LC7 domain-containing protein [uncultured Algibacter sp.]|uniref:roadblock/LC7 domain-containing protein n=1 Tax=uncultured Algibacter sp. TaxID=298659 RepID=UPI003216CAC6